MANENSTGIEIKETGPIENKKPFEKFAADPGVKKLAQQIESLAGRDDWPADRYARISADDAARFLWSLSDEDYDLVRDWVDVAVAEADIGAGNDELWQMCLCDFTDTLEELLDVESAEGASGVEDGDSKEAEANGDLEPRDLLEKACSILAGEVPWKSAEDQLAAVENTLANASSEQREAVLQWAEDVVATNEAGGSIRDNGGTLLNVPDLLREFFDWEAAEAAAIEVAAEEKPEEKPAQNQKAGDPQSKVEAQPVQRPETPLEAIMRIERELPSAWKFLEDAKSVAESRKASYDAAKKHVDAMQIALNAMVEELTEAINGFQGGNYQYRLPFDRSSESNASNSAATASPEGAAKSGIATDSAANQGTEEKVDTAPTPATHVAATATPNVGLVAADPIAGESVAVLVADQLSQRTNGKSDGAGIPQGTVDLLVDASLGTIGLLEEHMRRRGEYWARDIKGVGPGKAEKITAALGVLRQCFPLPVADTEPLEELILDEVAYQDGVSAKTIGAPRACPYQPNGHQGRSWLKGYDDQTKTEELTAGATPAASTEGGE